MATHQARALLLIPPLMGFIRGYFMNTAVIIFFCSLGAYFVGLIVWVLIKRARYKKKYNKELKEKQNEEAQDHDIHS